MAHGAMIHAAMVHGHILGRRHLLFGRRGGIRLARKGRHRAVPVQQRAPKPRMCSAWARRRPERRDQVDGGHRQPLRAAARVPRREAAPRRAKATANAWVRPDMEPNRRQAGGGSVGEGGSRRGPSDQHRIGRGREATSDGCRGAVDVAQGCRPRRQLPRGTFPAARRYGTTAVPIALRSARAAWQQDSPSGMA